MNGNDSAEEKRYDVQAVKDRLMEYRESEREIDTQIERLERLQSKMYGVGSQQITDMPRNPSPSNDRMISMIAQKDELESGIRKMVQDHSTERQNIEKILKKLKRSDERAVIRIRYIDGENWTDVAEVMFGTKDDYEGKEDSYLRRVMILHGRALLNMAKTIEDGKEQEEQ